MGTLLLAIVLNEVHGGQFTICWHGLISPSSTGWHRAELIHAAITHLNEMVAGGTDYAALDRLQGCLVENHADITNHYIKMGVLGGMPLMLLFIYVLVVAFRDGGVVLRGSAGESFEGGSFGPLAPILFRTAATWMSISLLTRRWCFYTWFLQPSVR